LCGGRSEREARSRVRFGAILGRGLRHGDDPGVDKLGDAMLIEIDCGDYALDRPAPIVNPETKKLLMNLKELIE